MFEPTIPLGDPELMRVSEFERYLHEPGGPRSVGTIAESHAASLSPSLLADLGRFGNEGQASEVLEVLAACVRHAQNVVIHLQMGEAVVPLTVFPIARIVHCPLPVPHWLEQRPTELRVLHVEPAIMRPPGDEESSLIGEGHHYHSLRPVLWELALRGSRGSLLPEIAGGVVYRVALGFNLGALRVNGALQAGVRRLQQKSSNFREVSDWPGFDTERAARMLNALYLQSGLILSRTHRGALADSWFGALGRH